VRFVAFALFIGCALLITAFPVLAQLLAERGWSKTPFGALAIACAAAADVTAWCVLAIVLAIAGGAHGDSLSGSRSRAPWASSSS
jgi:Kef-type K+ transport system membrane component KefB